MRRSDGVAAPPVSFPNSTIGIRRLLRKFREVALPADAPILFESTGPYHWKAADTLRTAGYLAKIVNPLHSKQIARHSIRKRKTDKVDAAQLAFLASQGYGYPFRDTEELADRKALVRHYFKLRDAAMALGRHEAYLHDHRGISYRSVSPLLKRRCEALQREIIDLFSKGNDLRYLDSIPGVSPFLAAVLLAELMPVDRFDRVEQLVAYAGLDPSVKQSGGKAARYGKLSKRGSPILRRALFLAAFGAFCHAPLRPLYLQYKERGLHHTAALCILARKILRIAVTLLKKRTEFDVRYLDLPPAKS